jgi:hypothetical protein
VRNRPETREASTRSQQRQAFEKMGTDAFALKSIFDGKSHLCAFGVARDVGSRADNNFFSLMTASDNECKFRVGIG